MEVPTLEYVSITGGAALANGVAQKLDNNARFVTMLVVFGAGTGAGVVTLEEAHDPDYTGTRRCARASRRW